MDHDQEKFYEDEVQETAAQHQPGVGDDIDDMKYFLELLKLIRTAIKSGTNVPLTGKKIIDAEKCLLIIDDMEKNLPDAVQYGMQMFAEQDRILGDAETAAMKQVSSAEMRASAALEKAKKEAEQIMADAEMEARAMLQDAQERADHMVSESEIVRRATEEARVIKNDARVDASELRLKANHDAYALLASVEDELREACKAVHKHCEALGDGME